MEDSLDQIKRQITSGILHLTEEEQAAVQSLVDIFPQYSQWSLSAVVVLHSRTFESAADQLITCCINFLFSNDDISLADFLHPEPGTDSDLCPQTVIASRSKIPSFSAGVSSAFQGGNAATLFPSAVTTTISTPPTLTASGTPSHPITTYSIAAKAADSLNTQCVSNLSSLCSPFSMSPCSPSPSASSPAMGSTLTKVLPVCSGDSAVCSISNSVKLPVPSSNSCAASVEASSVSKAINNFDKSAASDYSGGNTYDCDPLSQPSGKSGMHLSAQKDSLIKTVKSELNTKESLDQPVKSDESSSDSLPDFDFVTSTPQVKSDVSEAVSSCKPSFSPESLCVIQPDVKKDVVGNHPDSQSSTSSDGSQLPELSDIFKTRKRKISEEHDSDPEVMNTVVGTKDVGETGSRIPSASAVSTVVKGTLQQAKSDPSEVQSWNVSEEGISRKKKVLPGSFRKGTGHHAENSEKTWSSYHTEKCPPLSVSSPCQKNSFVNDDEDIFEEEVLLHDHAEILPVISPPKRKRPSLQGGDEKASSISVTLSCLSSSPVVKPPVFKADHSVKYLGKNNVLSPSSNTTCTLFPSTSYTTSTLFPSTSSTTSTLFLSTSNTTSMLFGDFPSTRNTTSVLFPSTSSSISTLFPSTSNTTSTLVPPTNSATSTLFPSTSNTTSTLFPYSSNTTSTLFPPTNSATSTLFPSTSSTTSTLFPYSSNTTNTLFPSTSSTTSTVFPSTSSTTSTVFPYSSCTTSTLFPSTSSTTSTVFPSTSNATSTLFPSTSSTTSTLFPSTSNTTSTLVPPTNSATSTLFPSTSSTTSTLFPYSSNTTNTLFPSTSSTTSTVFPSTSSTTSTVFPSTSSTTSTVFPSTSNATSTLFPSTSSTTSTVFPSTSNTTSTLFPSTSSTTSTVFPSTSNTTSTLFPSTSNTTSTVFPSTSSTISALFPSTSNATSTLFPSASNASSTLFPSTSSTTSTLFPSTSSATSTVFPSTSNATSTLFPSTSSTTSTLFPSTSNTTSTLVPPTNSATSTLFPSTSSTTSTLFPYSSNTTNTLFPSTSSTTSTVFPSTSSTTSTVFPSTSNTTSTLFPSTSSTTSTVFPSTSSTTSTVFPSTSNATSTLFPSTSSTTSTVFPSTSNTTSTLFPSTSSTTSTVFPSTSNTTSTLFPSTSNTTSTVFPSTNSTISALFPSTSNATSTLFPSASNASSTLFPSTSSTTSTLFPSTSSATSTVFPSAISTTITLFPSTSNTTSALFPFTNNTTSTQFPFTNTSNVLIPSSSSTTNVPLSTSSTISKMLPSSASPFTSTTGTSSSASKVFLPSKSAGMPLFDISSSTIKASSSASASATSTFIPDPRDNLQKRMDSLDARILGLLGTTDTLSVDYKSNDPFHIHSQAAPSPLSTFTAWRSSTAVKSQSDVPSKKMTRIHSTTSLIPTTTKVIDSSCGLSDGKVKVSGGIQAESVSIPVTETTFASSSVGSRPGFAGLCFLDQKPTNSNSFLTATGWRGEGATVTSADTNDSSTVTGAGNTNCTSVNSIQAALNTETNCDNNVSSPQSQTCSREKTNVSTISHNNAVSFAEVVRNPIARATVFHHPQKVPALGRDLPKVEHNLNARSSHSHNPQIVPAFGVRGSLWPARSSPSSIPPSLLRQWPQVLQTSAPAMAADVAGGKRALEVPVVTLPKHGHLLDLAPIPSSSKGGRREGGGVVLSPSKFGGGLAGVEHLAKQDGGGDVQPARCPPGPMDSVEEAEPMVLDDSQDSVEIVAATPTTVLDLTILGPSKHDPASQTAANPVLPVDVIDLEAPGPSGVDPVANQGHPERSLGLDFGINKVLEVFPGINRAHVSQLLEGFLAGHTLDEALNHTMGALLDNPQPVVRPDNPQHQELEITVVHMQSSSSMSSGRDYYTDYSGLSPVPINVAADRLSMEFRDVRMDTINTVLKHYNNHYAPAHRCLSRALHTAAHDLKKNKATRQYTRPPSMKVKLNEGEASEKTMQAWLMKNMRQFVATRLHEKNKQLAEEVEFVARRSQLDKEEVDRKVAWELLESEYEQEGQAIECGCCFAEHPFENLVQCFEGHLFCCQCLLGYAREAIFGSGKLHLACMTENCDSTFPKSQLLKALPDDVMGKYEERMAEENLNKAAMPDLVRCPSCNLAAVLDQSIQNFRCPNASCRKETCRDCKEDWAEHKGKKCHQLEKKDETKLRTNYEEKMTAARVRRCPSCHAQFFKEEGCNKMTCRCGATMCYICRAPQISYKHFCRHPRDPGMGCTKCNSCSLWTNPDEDEQRAIAEIQKEAQEKRKEHGFLDDKVIGVPEKRQRTK